LNKESNGSINFGGSKLAGMRSAVINYFENRLSGMQSIAVMTPTVEMIYDSPPLKPLREKLGDQSIIYLDAAIERLMREGGNSKMQR
jgi:hypothetical protein